MITKYDKFISEKKEYTEKDPEFWAIRDYYWINGLLNARQAVNFSHSDITKIPFKFGVVHGTFDVDNCMLTTLENSPSVVHGAFFCRNNKFTDLYGSPDYIKGFFECKYNHELKSLDHCPKEMMNLSCDEKFIRDRPLEDYPIAIYHNERTFEFENKYFDRVYGIVYKNQDMFRPLLDDKIRFHQQVMRMDPSLIPIYNTIKPPSNRTVI